LRQGVQNLVEGGPLATGVGPTGQHTQKKLRNDSESEYRGCLYQLKNENTSKNAKKQQPTENQKNTKHQNIS